MWLPRPRNLILALVAAGVLLALGLVIAQDQETLRVRTPLAASEPLFPDYLARLVGRAITNGDDYVVLRNGDEAFAAMLAAIDSAQQRISFETYVYKEGQVADAFTRALVAAARRGVTVQVVLDAVGAGGSERADMKALEDAGCQVGWFNPIRHSMLEEINYRTHRKILVVDGKVAHVGGLGVADYWMGDADSKDHWRDTQFEVRGPAVDLVRGRLQRPEAAVSADHRCRPPHLGHPIPLLHYG